MLLLRIKFASLVKKKLIKIPLFFQILNLELKRFFGIIDDTINEVVVCHNIGRLVNAYDFSKLPLWRFNLKIDDK